MRIAVLAAILVGAAVLEVVLLRRIVFHQAGGWGDPHEAFVYITAWATLPLLWSALLLVAATHWRRAEALPASALLFVAVAGPLFPYIALVQYGHATPVIMLVGLALQCVAVLVATVRTVIGQRNAA